MMFSIQKKTTTSITSQSPDNSMALVHLPPIFPEVCVYRYYIHVIYAYTLQCLYALQTVCILLCFAFRTPPLHLHHVQVRARTIQPLFYVFHPSLQKYTVQYHRFIIPEYYNLHIIIIIIIIVCINFTHHYMHYICICIHVCILFCIQETTTTPMPCSS